MTPNKNGRIYPKEAFDCLYPDWDGTLINGKHDFDKDGYCNVCGKYNCNAKTRSISSSIKDPIKALMKKIGYEIDEEAKKTEKASKPRKLKTKWTVEIGELQTFTGVDTEAEFIKALSEEIRKEVDREIILKI